MFFFFNNTVKSDRKHCSLFVFPAVLHLGHSLMQQLQLSGHLIRQVVIDLVHEVRPHLLHLPLPEHLIQGEELVQVHLALQTLQVERVLTRHVAYSRGHRTGLALQPPEHPVQDPDVVSKTRPQEAGSRALTEPVHVEDLWKLGSGPVGHAQPVREVLSKVVAKEWPHGKWVMHDHFSWKREKSQEQKEDGEDGSVSFFLLNWFLTMNLGV